MNALFATLTDRFRKMSKETPETVTRDEEKASRPRADVPRVPDIPSTPGEGKRS